jgi:hypothetical protein
MPSLTSSSTSPTEVVSPSEEVVRHFLQQHEPPTIVQRQDQSPTYNPMK